MKKVKFSSQKVVAYSRITTKEQAEKGYSFQVQREAIKTYTPKNNLKIVREFTDIGSDSSKLEGFNRMFDFLNYSNSGCDTILVFKLDRFTKENYEYLKQLGIKIIEVSSPKSLLLQQIITAPFASVDKMKRSAIAKAAWKKKQEQANGNKPVFISIPFNVA